jgi:hypothetical protein
MPVSEKQAHCTEKGPLQKKQAKACFNSNDYAIVKRLFGYKYKNV